MAQRITYFSGWGDLNLTLLNKRNVLRVLCGFFFHAFSSKTCPLINWCLQIAPRGCVCPATSPHRRGQAPRYAVRLGSWKMDEGLGFIFHSPACNFTRLYIFAVQYSRHKSGVNHVTPTNWQPDDGWFG